MMCWRVTQRIVVAAMAASLLCCTVAQAKGRPKQAAYTIVPFIHPDYVSTRSAVSDLNEEGQAVGFVELANGNALAVHLDLATGVYTSLPGGGPSTSAGGVNDLNQIVGKDGDFGAFWSSPSASPEPLLPLDPTTDLPPGTLSLGVQSGALDINEDGIVIGGSEEFFEVDNGEDEPKTYFSIRTSVVWRVAGGVVTEGPLPLPPLNGHAESHAGPGSLNELVGGSAQVAGYSSGPSEAVVWTIRLNSDGTLALPGAPVSLSPSQSKGNGINNLGDVCGRWDKRPFVALAGQDPEALPVPRNTQDGYADAINDLREIVGFLDIQKSTGGMINPPQWHAYLWRGDQMIDLGKQIASNSGWDKLEWATTINNAGIIAGWGKFDVNHRGFLLIPNLSN